nr:MATE family efflux transporter [Mangrovicella endophytica]
METLQPSRAAVERDDLRWFAQVRATLALGLPLVGSQLAQMSINVTDTVMVGWLGATQLAAGVLAAQTFFLVWMFGAGFAHAIMPLAAAAQGQGDHRAVRRSVRMGLWILTGYSLLVMLPLWHTEAILVLLRQDPQVAAMAGRFMRILQWSMLPALLLMGLRSYLSALSRADIVLWATLVGAVVNGFLDYALIFGHFGAPHLGMTGAALASVATNLIILSVLFLYCFGHPDLRRHEIFARIWRPDWHDFFVILRLGWPIGATIVAEVGLFTATSIMMGWIGTLELAAHGIALQLTGIAFMVPLGLSQAATVRVGLAHGRGDPHGLARAGIAAIGVTMAFSLIGAFVFWTLPGALIGLYLDDTKPNAAEVLAVAVPLLAVAAAFQIVDGLQAIGTGLLRGLKDTRTPMLIAIFSYWLVGLPVAYVLGFVLGWGGVGIWWGLAVGLAGAAVLMNWRFYHREKLGLIRSS